MSILVKLDTTMTPATTIDEVIEQLDAIIAAEMIENSYLTFFPILYKKVTKRIKTGIAQNEFDDGPRMERLDVIFANRYLTAYFNFKAEKPISESWLRTFNEAKSRPLLIMQHLLLGINAHINLDLGVAVVNTLNPDETLDEIKSDFDTINQILENMVDEVQEGIGQVSPLFYLLEKVGKGKEDKVVSFSINLARDGAWLFAQEYCLLPNHETLERRDTVISVLANKIITTKSRWLRWVIKRVRWLEEKEVARVARALSN